MSGKPQEISSAVRKILKEARVARLATIDANGGPHLVPVCFAYDGERLYTAIDHKPKRVPAERLARLQNIGAEPHVALLIDQYDEDWTRLWYILIRGSAKLLPEPADTERTEAIHQLRVKYSQYTHKMLTDDAPVICITPERITTWGKI
jgi:PPOX class probable F420-dependent enzyme